jgi:alkanesulfonate monooxygenase SsuD/methylene tetrahydromethanopterin reductase-like flavin-dependent oxidoreductase (luciferase family)
VHDHILWGTEQHRTHLSAGAAEALEESQKPNFYESVTTLAYISGQTNSVKLGIAVLVLPLRNPVVLAKQLANLDVLSEGRLIVGVAPGAPNITKHEFEAIGSDYVERGKITDEYIDSMKKIWAENLPSFSGSFVKFNEIQMFPKPAQKELGVLVGGGERSISPRALKRVVELGDGWIPAYLTPEEAAEGIAKIREGFTSNGKSLDRLLIAHEMFTCVDRDSSNARRLAAKSLSTNFVSVEEGIRRSLVGSSDEIARKLELYSKAGIEITELKFVYSNIESLIEMMRLFSKSVLPSFG